MPSLERLLDGRHEVVVVVSQQDRPRGRGRKTLPSPVTALALERGLPTLRPANVGAPEVADALREHAPDLGVVVAYGQFLPKRIRELPRLGYCINGHASLLPRWRGAAPIARAILAGDSETGVCVMRVEREMDAGPVAARRALPIGPEETAGELAERMARLTAELVAAVVEDVAAERVTWTEQAPDGIRLAPKLTREEALLDFREPAAALVRRVRAFAPEPGARATLAGEPLRILAARSEPGPVSGVPGGVQSDGKRLRVATGDGWFVPLVLQRPGKRPLASDAFLRGHPLPDGARFDPPPSQP